MHCNQIIFSFHTGLIFIGVYRLIIRKLIYSAPSLNRHLLCSRQFGSFKMVKTNPIVIFRLPMIPTDHFHPNAGLFGILRKSVILPLPPVNLVIPSPIRTSWDTAEVSVSLFGAPKHLWFSILVGTIHGFHNGSVDHSHRNSTRWNCIVGNHESYKQCLQEKLCKAEQDCYAIVIAFYCSFSQRCQAIFQKVMILQLRVFTIYFISNHIKTLFYQCLLLRELFS